MLQRLNFSPRQGWTAWPASADPRTSAARLWASLRTRLSGEDEHQSEGRAGWTALAINLVMFLMLASALVGSYAGEKASAGLEARAHSTASLQAAVLRTELERYRSLPYVLAHDPDVAEVLSTPSNDAAHRLDLKLAALSRETKVGVAYVLDRSAVGVAMSNWDSPVPYCRPRLRDGGTSLTGCINRYYFTGAMEHGRAEFFALGRANGRPGMYFSNAVEAAGRRIGVVVAKVEFAAIEKEWARAGVTTFVSDANGVILISSVPEWRFRTLARLAPEAKARLIASGQFGASPLAPLNLSEEKDAEGLVEASLPGQDEKKFMISAVPLISPGWTLHVMVPAGKEVRTAKLAAGLILFLSGILVLTVVGIVVRRRTRRAIEAAREVAARDELERRVAQRTSELTRANQRLHDEVEEKRRISKNLSLLQDELVQANKLATLGQITAGVAHELNQPVAAIRAYAENAVVLLDRQQEATARKNLGLIGDLTDRISVITGELRAFSRRTSGKAAPVEVTAAIDGALLLTSHRIAAEGVKVLRIGERAGLLVNAERVRLEQVLVNLLQNALDAMSQLAVRTLTISVEEKRGKVLIHVTDSGAGISEATFKTLFMPFQTTKANGLGLGLVISHDIVTEFGGDLTAKRLDRGARFTVSLRSAAA